MTINLDLIKIGQESILKAGLIDLPTYLFFSDESGFEKSAVTFVAYGIRSSINQLINEYYNLTTEDFYSNQLRAVVSGASGGYFKYLLTGQIPLVGSLNNIGYELCNNFDACSNDPLNNAIFTVLLEASDASLQVYINTIMNNPQGSVSAAIYGGAKAGAAISVFINLLYVPAVDVEIHKNLIAGEDFNS